MKKVLFLFPPYLPGAARSPYLAPHLLTTILRKEGFDVQNTDLNNHFIRRVCTAPVVEYLKKTVEELVTNTTGKTVHQVILNHCTALLHNLNSNRPVTLSSQIVFSNYLKKFALRNLSTVEEYRDNGLELPDLLRETFQQMVDELDLDQRVVCISCAFGDQLLYALELARMIKKRSPKTRIILGGAQISLLPKEVILEISRFKLFNTVFTGYAEESIVKVIEECDDNYFTIPVVGPAATTKKLNELPYTEFDEFEIYENPSMPVLVNKGCYWGKCSFCDYILMGDLGGFRYISRSVDIVFDEIKQLRKKYPHTVVNLVSDAVPPKFYKELAMRANQENFPLRTHSYMINNANLTEEFFSEAAKAKIGTIVFGTESTNDRVLELMKKQARREDILENFRLARKYGISIKVNLIPNYPTTTYAEAAQTIKDISQYKDAISALAVFEFYLSANTEMDKDPETFALAIDQNVPYLKTSHNGFHSRDFRTMKGMTPEEEKKVYTILDYLAAECALNGARVNFRRFAAENAVHHLKLNTDYNLFMEGGAWYLFSFKHSDRFKLTDQDLDYIQKLEQGKLQVHEIAADGDQGFQWAEKFYSLGIFS